MTAIQSPCDEAVVRAAPQSRQYSNATGRAVLAAAILGSTMTFVDGSVVNVALPVLREKLEASAGLGPLLGRWLVQSISWRWIFFINLPLAAIVLVIVWWRVPESRGEAARGRIDWTGTAVVTAGLFGLVFGLIEGERRGFTDARIRLSLALDVLALVAFAVVGCLQRSHWAAPRAVRFWCGARPDKSRRDARPRQFSGIRRYERARS